MIKAIAKCVRAGNAQAGDTPKRLREPFTKNVSIFYSFDISAQLQRSIRLSGVF
jgi:hypothetical protein